MGIILASSSARRKEIFEQLGVKGKIITPEVEEVVLETPVETSVYNATEKVKWVSRNKKADSGSIILGFDTLVFVDDRIIGKPQNKKESKITLKHLSGKWHKVYTGIAVLKKETLFQDYDVSNVKFHQLTDSQISYYVDSGETLDKAGSYGIQDKNMSFIESIEGSFSNVVGFPLEASRNLLKEVGVKI